MASSSIHQKKLSPYTFEPATAEQRAAAVTPPTRPAPCLHWTDAFTGSLTGITGAAAVAFALPFGPGIPAVGLAYVLGAGASGLATAPALRMTAQTLYGWLFPSSPVQPHPLWRDAYRWLSDQGICDGQVVLLDCVPVTRLEGLKGHPWSLGNAHCNKLAIALSREARAQRGPAPATDRRPPSAETVVFEALLQR